MKKRKVVIDTDVGIDDAEALIYLLSCKDIEVLAITLVSGNASMNIIKENMRKFMGFLERGHIPIYEGGSYNLLGKFIKSDGYFGENAFANIELPEQPVRINETMNAPSALLHYTKKYPGEVSLIFIGPLTNLGLAFLLDNDFASNCASITCMGGDRSKTTFKNVTPYAEFNFWCDPLAVRIMRDCVHLPNDKPIVLIDWYLCWNHLLPVSLYEEINEAFNTNKSRNPHTELMTIIRDFKNQIIARSLWDGGILTADPFAAVVWEDPAIIKKSTRVSIDCIVLDGEEIGHCSFTPDPNGKFLLIDEIDVPKMKEAMLDRILNA